MTAKLSLLALVTILVGCASTTDVVPYGKDSFMLSTGDVWGAHSTGSLQVKAAQRASEFCAQRGKVFIVRNTGGQGVQLFSATSSTLIFSCISEGDPEYQRPNLRREPSAVIEDRRR